MMYRMTAAFITAAIMWGCNSTGPEKNPEIIFRNRTASTYNAIYIAACANPTWGTNRLQGAVILPNADRAFEVEPGCWDVRGETTDNKYVEFHAIELKSGKYTVTATN